MCQLEEPEFYFRWYWRIALHVNLETHDSLADTSIWIPSQTASHLIVVSLQTKRDRFCAFKILTHKACGQTKPLRKFWSNNP